MLQCNVDKGENSISSGNSEASEPLALYPQYSLSSTIHDAFVCKESHTYTASGDVMFLGDLTIESGANILLDRGCRISVGGSLYTATTGPKWRITSLSGFVGSTFTSQLAVTGLAGLLCWKGMDHISKMGSSLICRMGS